ncbi:hypothetical protein SDJN02_18852 [Cucurbita argyrosperma subsp. argyrosperma]|nr:hypothetical protein SDJN02_18852 [Cucurbita argyrosperma subsp. argyrosperma]
MITGVASDLNLEPLLNIENILFTLKSDFILFICLSINSSLPPPQDILVAHRAEESDVSGLGLAGW